MTNGHTGLPGEKKEWVSFFEGNYIFRRIELINFKDIIIDKKVFCEKNYAIAANKENPDLSPITNLKQITLRSVSDDRKIRFYDPNPEWLKY